MDATPLETWAHHLAQRHLAHLAHLTSSSPPAAELPVLLHLAEQVPSAQLPLEVLLDLAVVCPPWPQDGAGADPVRALFDRRWAATTDADDRTASLAGLAEALVALGSSADSPVRLALVFALLRMGGEPAVSAVLALERELVQGLLEELARTYASAASTLSIRLVCLHALSLLLGASSGVASSAPLPPLAAVLPTLPAPSDELPKPFASLWSDGETLFGLSSRVIDAPGWGDVAMQLLQLEGDRKEWETEALRLEQTETLYPSTGVPATTPEARPQPTDPAVLASIEQIQVILPDLSAAFIAGAVAHSYFTAAPPAGAPATTVEERIIEAIFDSAPLPEDLNDLLSAPAPTVHDDFPVMAPSSAVNAAAEAEFLALARARREQTEQATGGAVDIVYRKETSQVVPQISEAVPQSVRESIMRLVEVQREEQEEEEREERERQASRRAAAGKAKEDAKASAAAATADDDDLEEDEHVSARMRGTAIIGADGEESGDDDDEDATHAAPTGPVPIDSDSLLEDTYMSNKKVFDRDSATRRGKERAALKDKTGLSDEQLEGWRIMLERNPRRMASIQARLGMFTPSASATSSNNAKPQPASNGSHPNGSGANRGRGGGGGGGERGGGRGGRGGRGENKGSRGHQNAARKRGADRKAAMQGPKA